MKNAVLIVCSLCLVIAVTVMAPKDGLGLFLDQSTERLTIGQGVIFAIAMLIGIVAGRLHAMLSSDDSTVGLVLTGVLNDKQLWKALVSSPIVFGLIYSLLVQTKDGVAGVIIAFQNGFFCDVLLRREQKQVEIKKEA